nr:DNA internalization-related competence protein ComEC/Rec2 [Enterococcus sp. 9E7_DIV0242]
MTGLFWLICLIRLFKTERRDLIIWAIVFSLLVLFCAVFVRLKEYPETLNSGPVKMLAFQVDTDNIKVDGDYLQLEGHVYLDDSRQRVRAVYSLGSEEEQTRWQNVDQALLATVSGVLERPSVKTNLNGFDYRSNLRNSSINQILTIESFHDLKVRKVSWYDVITHLSIVRRRLLLYCERKFSPAIATYIQILLLGEQSADSELTDTFNQLGILHLFSLSGMHVVFFFQFFRLIALKLGVTIEQWFWLQLVLSFIFGGLTGFSISVSRSLLQTNISECNRRFQLKFSSLDTWSLTLFCGVICQPFSLFTLAGQYSYSLSFFILFIGPALNGIKQRSVQQLCFSMLLSIFTLPILAVSSYDWKPVGIVLTFLLLPLFEKVLLPNLTILFVSSFFIRVPLAEPLMEKLLQILNDFFHWLGRMNPFSATIGHISTGLFIIEFLLIFLVLLFLEKKWQRSVIFLGILLLLINQKYVLQKGIIAYIDVGQGDSILIQAPFHGETILIDTGGKLDFSKEEWRERKNKKNNADYTVLPFLKSRGIDNLDKVIITHADTDHMGDLLSISDKVFIKQVYFPKGAEADVPFLNMLQQLAQRGTEVSPILAGEKIDSLFQLRVLSPSSVGEGGNNDSLVIHTKIAAANFLFTGDLEETGELELIRKYPQLPVDILKIAHHGSKTSTSKAFITQLKPKQAIISSGRNNRFGHPHSETLATLSESDVAVFQTAESGMIYYEWLPFIALSEAQTILDSD